MRVFNFFLNFKAQICKYLKKYQQCQKIFHFYTPWKRQKIKGFLTFSKGIEMENLSVIRQKGESQNGCFKKKKHVKFSEKQTFLTPWYTHVCVLGGKKCSFFGKFDVLCFLETPVSRFALLPYYRWIGLIWVKIDILLQLCVYEILVTFHEIVHKYNIHSFYDESILFSFFLSQFSE